MTVDPRDERIWEGLVTRLEGVEAHVKEPPPWRGAEPTSARPDGVALGPTLVARPPQGSRRPTSRRPLAIGGAALVFALIAVTLVARPTGPDRFGASPPASSSGSTPSSGSPANTWGPLAVIPPQDGADTARDEGTLRITDTCVTLERAGEVQLLFWPADRTTWDGVARAVTFENFDGTVVTVSDGDDVVLGGGGDSELESGRSGEEWVDGMEWVAPPDTSCPLETRWGVGAVERIGAGPQVSPVTTVVESAGLKLVAEFDRMEVEAGGTVTVNLSIENTRPTDVVFDEPCNVSAMTVAVRAPVEPIGRDWDGIAAAFKSYALETSTGTPIESSIREPLRTNAKGEPCHATASGAGVGGTLKLIEAGTTYETVLTWAAEIVPGVPAAPGPAPYTIAVAFDHKDAANGLFSVESLDATGTITVLEGAASAISAGQALDAALGDAKFAAWLEQQPKDAWANTNLFLQGRGFAEGYPEVPYWDVELFREPRSWAILYIDAMTGEVLRRNFCNIPCDR
jgi:hypothetical protein